MMYGIVVLSVVSNQKKLEPCELITIQLTIANVIEFSIFGNYITEVDEVLEF